MVEHHVNRCLTRRSRHARPVRRHPDIAVSGVGQIHRSYATVADEHPLDEPVPLDGVVHAISRIRRYAVRYSVDDYGNLTLISPLCWSRLRPW